MIGTRLSWREIAVLRAYARYLRQVRFPYSVDYIAETMAHHLQIAASIVELFLTRFSPVFDGDEDWRALPVPAGERYVPTWMEICVTVAFITFAVVAFRWIANRMPIMYEHPDWKGVH